MNESKGWSLGCTYAATTPIIDPRAWGSSNSDNARRKNISRAQWRGGRATSPLHLLDLGGEVLLLLFLLPVSEVEPHEARHLEACIDANR